MQTLPTLIQPHEVVNGGVLKATPANVRFDITLIAQHIQDAEELHVLPILGADLLADMRTKKAGAVSQYNTDVAPLVPAFADADDAAYEALWKAHLMRFCAWAVYYEALPFLAVSVGVNGLYQTKTEYADNVGTVGAKFLQDQVRRRLESMRSAIETYLCANKSDFPLWDSSACPNSECESESKNIISRFGLHYITTNE